MSTLTPLLAMSFLALIPVIILALFGSMFLILIARPSKYDTLVGTNRFHRMMIIFLAAKHPEMFVKGFPQLSKDIKETSFVDAWMGRIKNYDKHVKQGFDAIYKEQL